MATITLRPDVYDKAAIFARKDKLNIAAPQKVDTERWKTDGK